MRIALLTEGSYPTSEGGVSLWCDQLTTGLSEYEFDIHAIVATGTEPTTWVLPPNVVALTLQGMLPFAHDQQLPALLTSPKVMDLVLELGVTVPRPAGRPARTQSCRPRVLGCTRRQRRSGDHCLPGRGAAARCEWCGAGYHDVGKPTGATIQVVRKTGIASGLLSRAEQPVPLAGSKRRVNELGLPRLVRGPSDDWIVLVVPEQNDGAVGHLAVVHVQLRDDSSIEHLAAAMNPVGDGLAEIEAAVTELSPSFDPAGLRALTSEAILLAPVGSIAEQLRPANTPENWLRSLKTG